MYRLSLAYILVAVALGSGSLRPQNAVGNKQVDDKQPQAVVEDEVPDDELAPPAVKFDTQSLPPLIRALYQATRETKEPAILDQLSEAKHILESGANVKATDQQQRTALHWAIFGSSYSTKPKVLVSYEEIANELITKGVDINHQDVYQDTAFDYLLYSPNFEMQTLLLENGATSGFLAASSAYVADATGDRAKSAGKPNESSFADLVPGQTIDLRLTVPVYSDRSRTGDPIEAVVNYPLCKTGELVECPKGELLLPPGTKINGTILFAQKAPDKYSRPRLVLDFSNVVHTEGRRSPLYARVLSVDNARETVRNNEILGIVQPHASTKMTIAMTAVGAATPIAGYTIKAMQAVYGLSIRREIFYPEGTDLQIQVVRPTRLKQKQAWPGYRRLAVDPELSDIVAKAPMRTQTAGGKPSDVTNLMFIGSRQQLVTAFEEANWFTADELSIKSAAKTIQATIRQANYSSAPVSGLRINNQMPDLVFQKALNTFAQRHHLRIWKLQDTYAGHEVWLGAATHDIAISSARAKTAWSHRIDPHIDRERDWVATDLLFIGTAASYADIERPDAPRQTQNATGDQILTDGKMTVLALK
jgi:hypothetical protein